MELKHKTEYYILGKSQFLGLEPLDPGGCGLGIVSENDISDMLEELIQYKDKISSVIGSIGQDALYELSEEEILDGYEELCQLYKMAKDSEKGLLFTF